MDPKVCIRSYLHFNITSCLLVQPSNFCSHQYLYLSAPISRSFDGVWLIVFARATQGCPRSGSKPPNDPDISTFRTKSYNTSTFTEERTPQLPEIVLRLPTLLPRLLPPSLGKPRETLSKPRETLSRPREDFSFLCLEKLSSLGRVLEDSLLLDSRST